MQRRNIYSWLYNLTPTYIWRSQCLGFSSYVTLKLNRGSVLIVPLRRDRVTKSKILKVIAHMCRNMLNIFLELDHKRRRSGYLQTLHIWSCITYRALMQPQMHSLQHISYTIHWITSKIFFFNILKILWHLDIY